MVWHKKFGPAQHILGPVKGQGITLMHISYFRKICLQQEFKNHPNSSNDFFLWILSPTTMKKIIFHRNTVAWFLLHSKSNCCRGKYSTDETIWEYKVCSDTILTNLPQACYFFAKNLLLFTLFASWEFYYDLFTFIWIYSFKEN